MSEMESKRTSELNARLEKERLKMQLQEIDRQQLTVLGTEKKRFENICLVNIFINVHKECVYFVFCELDSSCE